MDPAALTLQRICRAADVTAPTVYYHFGNKDGLIAAAVERLVSDWLEMMDAAVSREGGLGQTLEQAVGAWEATITSPNRPIAVFAWATLLMAGSSEQCRDALVRARDRTLTLVTEALAPHMSEQIAAQLASLVVDAVLAAACSRTRPLCVAVLPPRCSTNSIRIGRGCGHGSRDLSDWSVRPPQRRARRETGAASLIRRPR